MAPERMTLRAVTRDGVTFLAMDDLVVWLRERIRKREVLRERMIEDDPPGLRDPDPGPLSAREVLEALSRGTVVGELEEVHDEG